MAKSHCTLKQLFFFLKLGFHNGCKCCMCHLHVLITMQHRLQTVLYLCVNCPCFNSHRAKLASLFGMDQHVNQTNESFQYTAPKQPRKISTSGERCQQCSSLIYWINSWTKFKHVLCLFLASAAQKSAPPPGAPAVLFGTAVQAFR